MITRTTTYFNPQFPNYPVGFFRTMVYTINNIDSGLTCLKILNHTQRVYVYLYVKQSNITVWAIYLFVVCLTQDYVLFVRFISMLHYTKVCTLRYNIHMGVRRGCKGAHLRPLDSVMNMHTSLCIAWQRDGCWRRLLLL